MIDRIQWLGHSSFCLQGPPLIYIDPLGIGRNAFLADVILISQASYDYYSPADVRKLCGPNTLILANAEVAEALAPLDVQALRPWHSVNYGRTRITAVPAAETGSFLDHSLGFLISLHYYDIYYAGGSALLPEAKHLRPDIAILPVGNRHNGLAAVEQAVDVVKALRPRWVIPNHRNSGAGGSYLDLKVFQEAVGDLAMVVMPGQVAAAG